MKELEIYIHIPFCAKKCNYCDFLSAPSDETTMHNYVKALIKEIELSGEKFNGYLVRSVFVGGGTPSILRGEWIEDTKTPLVERKNISEEGVMELEVTVWGKARGISNEASEFKALTLRNKPEIRHADTEFFEDDDLFLYFTAPTDGYVAAYLIDEKATAYCLLPYKNDEDGQQPVKHGKEYIFFSKEHADPAEKGITDEIYITCDDPNVEHSQLYILFSPNPYKKAVDTEKLVEDRELPRQLSYEDFTKWMGKLCARDQKMGRQIIPVTFRKK